MRKFLRAIEKSKDLVELPLGELIGNLKVYEMVLENGGKAKGIRDESSDDSDNQEDSEKESKFDDEYNFIVRNFKRLLKSGDGFGRRGNKFRRGNWFGGGANNNRGRGDRNRVVANLGEKEVSLVAATRTTSLAIVLRQMRSFVVSHGT